MTKEVSLDELWNSAPSGESVFEPHQVSGLPEGARRYLEHAIAPGAKLASAVRLRMHGEIKLRGWFPFTAEEVIYWNRGFIRSASVSVHGLPIRGSDRILDGQGAMRWKLLGIPVLTASGPRMTRSAIGRLQGESVWLSSVLCGNDVVWTAQNSLHPHGRFAVRGEAAELDICLDNRGRVKTVKLPRWGNPEGGDFHFVDFGILAEEENTFDGYAIPTRIRAGWYFATGRFESEGEFFRAAIDDAKYR
jgi:hypothetical protein